MCKKLTQEVFTRPDCPKWANWASVPQRQGMRKNLAEENERRIK